MPVMNRVETVAFLLTCLSMVPPLTGCRDAASQRTRVLAGGSPIARGTTSPDDERVVGPRHFVDGYPALNPDGSVNVVVEIPAGTTAKYEVDKASGVLRWERTRGALRTIEFLGYPGNYGMVPSTILPQDEGGDGDPLDVLVLGAALARGSVVRVRLIGVLRMLDEGENDDKLIAVPVQVDRESSFTELEDVSELGDRHPEAKRIIELWFSAYEGPAVVELKGWSGSAEAIALLSNACSSYRRFKERPGGEEGS